MKFEWDENKRTQNIAKHGIDFNAIEAVFEGYTLTVKDDRFDYGEDRFITFGLIKGHVVAVVHTENEEVIRIISARKATKYEQKKYYKGIAGCI